MLKDVLMSQNIQNTSFGTSFLVKGSKCAPKKITSELEEHSHLLGIVKKLPKFSVVETSHCGENRFGATLCSDVGDILEINTMGVASEIKFDDIHSKEGFHSIQDKEMKNSFVNQVFDNIISTVRDLASWDTI